MAPPRARTRRVIAGGEPQGDDEIECRDEEEIDETQQESHGVGHLG